jgi:uncharacterized protein (DUF1330 family)
MRTTTALTVAAALVVGFAAGQASAPQAAAQAPGGAQAGPRPAYLVVSSRPIQPDKMGPYRAAAVPLARAAGMEMLASGDPATHVLEGKWPHAGALSIERYRSMDELMKFWNSAGYQEAKKLRAGLSEMNFIVAIEGR